MINSYVDQVVSGVLVNALTEMGGRFVGGLRDPRGRLAGDLALARFYETERLTRKVPEPPSLQPKSQIQLASILRGHEIQAALQELLAVRLTDAPEADAARVRKIIVQVLITVNPEFRHFAPWLADHYDEEIVELVIRLTDAKPDLLNQIRNEALSTRIIAILNAIERHAAALGAHSRTEAGFLASYRRQVVDHHGKLEPPDFERRRRVPLADIYVPTEIFEVSPSGWVTSSRSQSGIAGSRGQHGSFDVWKLASCLDRTVLLGDPGGGKTTVANVLMHQLASQPEACVPFLVTLRDYAASDPPDRSIVGHIEHTLEAFYQCPAPTGLVDLLLLSGRGVVIFDGLDELLDTARRADVTNRVELFCSEYPFARVLVTSRLVGYDQARLDDSQFECYRLGGFGDKEVSAYARKWFALEPDSHEEDAQNFLAESAIVPDLRSNPLLLSLMCILYRGEGSLPRNRTEVYEQCANLLFRKWDARRHIHAELRAGKLVEPTLRHLASWLFTRADTQPAVTERELISVTAQFLHGRGFESQDEARDAAREFVEFCRGRMWVFSDTGTTASGQTLYQFTHRTFMEYFTAAQLAYASDSPEQLADNLLPSIDHERSWVVAELAVQIKDRTSSDGAQRIYDALLAGSDPRNNTQRANMLRFLALCLRSVDPSPQCVRGLTRQILADSLLAARSGLPNEGQVRHVLAYCGSYRETVADELDSVVRDTIQSGNQTDIVNVFRLADSLTTGLPGLTSTDDQDFWTTRGHLTIQSNVGVVVAMAQVDRYVRVMALHHGLISITQAMSMPDPLSALFYEGPGFFSKNIRPAYLSPTISALLAGIPQIQEPAVVINLQAIGDYLGQHRDTPWVHAIRLPNATQAVPAKSESGYIKLNESARLGATAIFAIIFEVSNSTDVPTRKRLGPLHDLRGYIMRRRANHPTTRRPDLPDLLAPDEFMRIFRHTNYQATRRSDLPDIPVPDEFKQIFRDWAEAKIDFTARD